MESASVNNENLTRATKIIIENQQFIKKVIRLNISDPHKAEDIFQDFFVSIVENPLPAKLYNSKAYLNRAVKNDVIDMCRNEKTYLKHKIRYASYLKTHHSEENTPQQEMIHRESLDEIMECAKRFLPSKHLKAILMRYFENMSIAKTAQKLDIDDRSVSRYVSVGLKKLRQSLEEENYDNYQCA